MDVSQRMAKSTGARVITLNEKDEETKDYREFWEELGEKPENIVRYHKFISLHINQNFY